MLGGEYGEQKTLKIERTKELLGEFYAGEIEFFESEQTHFRSRAEFGLFHEGESIRYVMRGANGERVFIEKCAIVDDKIAALMPCLKSALEASEELKFKIFGCEFVTTKREICAVLLYHRDVEQIKSPLAALHAKLGINCLVARSRGKKLVFGEELLREELAVDGGEIRYVLSETSFIQPNRGVNEKMLSYAVRAVSGGRDLLELYCGHGNFTIPLSFKFENVLATEINKSSIVKALENARINGANNIRFARMSAEEFVSALKGEREFHRLEGINLPGYDFSHVLVDPPRAGCDETVLNLIRNYENIIYVSCSQETLARDLAALASTHEVRSLALFDQFAHTNHIETIAVLLKISR